MKSLMARVTDGKENTGYVCAPETCGKNQGVRKKNTCQKQWKTPQARCSVEKNGKSVNQHEMEHMSPVCEDSRCLAPRLLS